MNRVIYVFIFLFHTIFSIDLIVNLPNGKIRGRSVQTPLKNVTFYAFQDIPFAEPPTGKLRFMPPVPLQRKWDDILNCTENKQICYQQNLNSSYESEDCLYLNVYTPIDINNNESPLAVFFFIHGGGYYYGNCTFDFLGPHIFMENGIVVVTADYRVGPFGFLSAGDTVLSGNAGLKDQNLALQWIQQNIHLFNGDPNKVTIGGQSAGSASVSYHVLSKKSKGLFRGAIEMSGTSLSTRFLQPNPRQIANNFAKAVDFDFNTSSTSEELLQFLQNVSANRIDAVSVLFYEDSLPRDFFYPYDFEPNLEANSSHAFITNFMYESYINGDFNHVPLITGMCSEDGVYAITHSRSGTLNNFHKYDKNASTLVPIDFKINNEAKKQMVGEKIKLIYNNESFEDNTGTGLRFISDVTYGKCLVKRAQLQARFADVYMFQFSFNGTLGKNDEYYPGAGRVRHSQNMNYLWISSKNPDIKSYPKDDVQTLERFVRLFSNFVKTLNPTPTNDSTLLGNVVWPKLEKDSSETVYLNINDTLEVREGFREPAMLKWIMLYEDYAEKPFNTF